MVALAAGAVRAVRPCGAVCVAPRGAALRVALRLLLRSDEFLLHKGPGPTSVSAGSRLGGGVATLLWILEQHMKTTRELRRGY